MTLINLTNDNPEPLKRELEFYSANKSEWLHEHSEEFVVISGEQVGGFFPDFETAFKGGIKAFGVARPFLIKEVCATEPVYIVY